jgi:sugar lactone lactonase YvrE
VDDLIRSTIQEALAVEQPPAGLRARVIGAVPMDVRPPRPRRVPSFQWAAGAVAIVLAASVIAELAYARNNATIRPAHPASGTRLISPEGIAVAPDGTIYISDYVGNRVYRLEPNGSLVTVAGGGAAYEGPATKSNIFGPAGLTFDQSGNLYFADNRGSTVRRVDRNGMLTTVLTIQGAGADFNSPLGVAFDASGMLYVGDFNGDVVAVQPDGSLTRLDLSAIASPPPVPGYLAFDAGGNLYIADRSPNPYFVGQSIQDPAGGCRIIRVKPDRSATVVAGTGKCGYSGDGGPAVGAELNDPNGIVFDSAGNLYFSDSNNHRIRRIDSRGVITTVVGTGAVGHGGDGGPASKATLSYPHGMAIRNGNLLYISDVSDTSGRVRVIQLPDGAITTLASGQSRVITPP